MELVIKIPESFEGHFNQDRFKDSFERILEDCKHSAILSGIYEFETIEMLIRAFENGTPLPKGHGRLIDADSTLATAWTNLYKHEDEWEKKDNDYLPFGRMYDQNGFECCQQTIVNAPTIIEADGGDEDEVSD